MLHHAALEIAADQLQASLGFWRVVGFEQVEAPESIAGRAVWVERQGTQIHLVPTSEPTVPPQGHVAVVVADFDTTLTRLGEAGVEVELREEHWGAPRAFVTAPGGHRVELMAAPPSGLRRSSI